MHLDVTECTANVEYVLNEVQQHWGDQYTLVTVDGLQLEDCEGTKGKLLVVKQNVFCLHAFYVSNVILCCQGLSKNAGLKFWSLLGTKFLPSLLII